MGGPGREKGQVKALEAHQAWRHHVSMRAGWDVVHSHRTQGWQMADRGYLTCRTKVLGLHVEI